MEKSPAARDRDRCQVSIDWSGSLALPWMKHKHLLCNASSRFAMVPVCGHLRHFQETMVVSTRSMRRCLPLREHLYRTLLGKFLTTAFQTKHSQWRMSLVQETVSRNNMAQTAAAAAAAGDADADGFNIPSASASWLHVNLDTYKLLFKSLVPRLQASDLLLKCLILVCKGAELL